MPLQYNLHMKDINYAEYTLFCNAEVTLFSFFHLTKPLQMKGNVIEKGC